MESSVLDAALSQGIWAVLAVLKEYIMADAKEINIKSSFRK